MSIGMMTIGKSGHFASSVWRVRGAKGGSMTSQKIDRLEIRKDEGQRRNCNAANNESRENRSWINVAKSRSCAIELRDQTLERSRGRKTSASIARQCGQKYVDSIASENSHDKREQLSFALQSYVRIDNVVSRVRETYEKERSMAILR